MKHKVFKGIVIEHVLLFKKEKKKVFGLLLLV